VVGSFLTLALILPPEACCAGAARLMKTGLTTFGLGSSLTGALFDGDFGATAFTCLSILLTLSAAFLIWSSTPLCGLSFEADSYASAFIPCGLAGTDGLDGFKLTGLDPSLDAASRYLAL